MTLTSSTRKNKPKKHYLRNSLLFLVLLAGIVLWQLIPIINGLGTMQHALSHAETTRAVFATILSNLYHKVQQAAIPLLRHL